ncbi:MAG: T9SS type A sorting domain-containing protein [Candidatus Krumholzibacteriia bacterium]
MPAGGRAQLLYEVALSPPHPLLQVGTGDRLSLRSQASEPLREITLARHLAGPRWQLVSAGDLAAGASRPAPPAREVLREELAATLAATITRGGLAAGVGPGQLADFQARYHWVERVLAAAEGRAGWTALYRAEGATCDRLLPLVTAPAAARRVRTLWFWVTDIPDGLSGAEPWPTAPPVPALGSVEVGPGDLELSEYGVIRQRYPADPGKSSRDLAWLGWTFHDDVWLLDPTDNLHGAAELPLFSQLGGHPDAADLMAGLGAVGGETCGGILAPWSEQVIIGDDDVRTDDGFFPPGSRPPVVVARAVGAGRAAAVASRGMLLGGLPENQMLMRRLVDWVAGSPTPVPPARIADLAVYPNPFNPQAEIVLTLAAAGPVLVTVHDLAGRRVAELWQGDLPEGRRHLAWNGRAQRGAAAAAGVYLLRVQAGGEVRCRKLTLVE